MALTELQRKIQSYGVPFRYTRLTRKDLGLRTCTYQLGHHSKHVAVPASAQRIWLKGILRNPAGIGQQLVVIGSTPSDYEAWAAAVSIIRAIIRHKSHAPINVVNLARPAIYTTTVTKPALVVLHNITDMSSDTRIEAARDRLMEFAEATVPIPVIIVVGGNPTEVMLDILRFQPDVILYASKRTASV